MGSRFLSLDGYPEFTELAGWRFAGDDMRPATMAETGIVSGHGDATRTQYTYEQSPSTSSWRRSGGRAVGHPVHAAPSIHTVLPETSTLSVPGLVVPENDRRRFYFSKLLTRHHGLSDNLANSDCHHSTTRTTS